ncbi:MAG: NAD(P)H-dependent oxidoreductase [Micropruina sp.]|uniref:CE1759 family FMN reductase n=1 Tax=Micropruina sp. TaxID=2737536 RepID=UPI0039E5BBC3
MTAGEIVVVSAGVGTPSSSQLLGERLGQAAQRALVADGVRVELRHIELRTLASDLAHQLVTQVPSPALSDAYAALGRAVGVIVVSPVFNASYSGLFKQFFDLLDEGTMAGRPVLLAATGGTARHSLVIDTALLPLFHYLKASIAPLGVFAATADWGEASGHLAARIEAASRAFAELVAQRPGLPVADEFELDAGFTDLLRGS